MVINIQVIQRPTSGMQIRSCFAYFSSFQCHNYETFHHELSGYCIADSIKVAYRLSLRALCCWSGGSDNAKILSVW